MSRLDAVTVTGPAPFSVALESTEPDPAGLWQPKSVKFDAWPDLDRELLYAGCLPGAPFDKPNHGALLEPDSLKKLLKDYGLWLSFLSHMGWLDPTQHPAERITRPRLKAYFLAMQSRALRAWTVLGRFSGLRIAMKVMAPGYDTGFILCPNGQTIRRYLVPHTREFIVPDAAVLFQWGVELMKTAEATLSRRPSQVVFRDGLIIAMLASRGRRLRSMALLRVGKEFLSRDGHFRIELEPHQVKTKKHDSFDLPTPLTPFIEIYLDTVRPALLQGNIDDALWIGRTGRPLEAKGLQGMISVRSKSRFGETFGPHRFRHAIETTARLRDPAHPGIGAGVLNGSRRVVEKHYNRANQTTAVQTMEGFVESRRKLER